MSRAHLPRRMLFVLPPISEQGGAVVPSHHPIMTASLAAVARRTGAEVHVIDAALQGLSPRSLAQQISLWSPDWVGFVPYEYRRELSEQSQIAVQFTNNQGAVASTYPLNPNGSPEGITGLTSIDGRATIMMPHPERVFRSQQLSWRPLEWKEYSPWMQIFLNAYKFSQGS